MKYGFEVEMSMLDGGKVENYSLAAMCEATFAHYARVLEGRT